MQPPAAASNVSDALMGGLASAAVQIRGRTVTNSSLLMCDFNGTRVRPSIDANGTVSCPVPADFPEGIVSFTLVGDGVPFTTRMQYYSTLSHKAFVKQDRVL